MTPDQYLLAVVQKYKVPTGRGSRSEQIGQALAPLTRQWAGQCFSEVTFSGSYAKDAAITLASDLDLFISLVVSCNGTLRELYESLYSFLSQRGLNPRRQNVSVRISYDVLTQWGLPQAGCPDRSSSRREICNMRGPDE